MAVQHRWDLMPAQAIALQKELAGQVDAHTPLDLDHLKTVAGVDVSVKNNISHAAVVVMSYPEFEILEAVTATMSTKFPYIPGLLSFREGEVILEAHQQLKLTPDVYIFDGMGIAHPRRLGIAAHIGLWLDRPTVGCSKTHLFGRYSEPDLERGSMSPLIAQNKDQSETIGMVLRTRTNVQPVYISPGNHATIETAVELVLSCTPRYRLPEPIRAAHNTAGQF